MILRVLLPFFIILSLSAKETQSPAKIIMKIEAGLYLPDASGSISNPFGSSSFQDDYGYSDLKASYFSLETTFDYDYVPNLYLSYFNMKDNKDAYLNRAVEVGENNFNSSVTTDINYNVLSAVLYQDFKVKGEYFMLFSKPQYSGDIEFDIGMNVKLIDWTFNIKKDNFSDGWIKVNQFVALPYLGFKYYFYDLIVYGNISTLALNKVESSAYQIGVDYMIVEDLYLSVSYIDEHFEIVEDRDTVDFDTSGYKLSFKYRF